MPKVIFIQPDGESREVHIDNGYSVMEGAVNADVPGITGECGGSLACGTCHVYIDACWTDVVGPPPAMEESMLEFANHVDASSRLCCQIFVDAGLDGLTVRIPEGV